MRLFFFRESLDLFRLHHPTSFRPEICNEHRGLVAIPMVGLRLTEFRRDLPRRVGDLNTSQPAVNRGRTRSGVRSSRYGRGGSRISLDQGSNPGHRPARRRFAETRSLEQGDKRERGGAQGRFRDCPRNCKRRAPRRIHWPSAGKEWVRSDPRVRRPAVVIENRPGRGDWGRRATAGHFAAAALRLHAPPYERGGRKGCG